MQTWRLDHGNQTLVVASHLNAIGHVVYLGPCLPQASCLTTLANACERDVTGGMLDANAPISLCPVEGNAYPGQAGMRLSNAQGMNLHPYFTLTKADASNKKLVLTYDDNSLGITYIAELAAAKANNVWQLSARIRSQTPIRLHWLAAPVLPVADHLNNLTEYGGRWLGEFQPNQTTFGTSALVRENRTGRTGHEHFPGLLAAQTNSYTHGDVCLWHYAWSGGHKMVAEQLPDGRRVVQFGHVNDAHQGLGTDFDTAELYVSYSAQGINGVSTAMQRLVREVLLPPNFTQPPRPIHYNCWEAIYFDHQPNILNDLVKRAASLGVERFVLDDGWFNKRTSDRVALGDWWVDKDKYPDGLQPLIASVKASGMEFGLWLEPEMISQDSNLYRQHPDWVLGSAEQTKGRYQWVLNLAKQEVQDYLYACIAALLSEYPIAYIKWDHNRVLPFADADQTYGTYALLKRLRQDFPQVEIESCASGGGRIDYGILHYANRVWLSDSNDALERLRIQHHSATFLPMLITGSHIGPRQCHTSGRNHSMAFRAWVAAQRHLGIEMDLGELDADELAKLKQVIAWWKTNRIWLQQADILRLDTSDKAVLAEQHLCHKQTRWVAFIGLTDTSQQVLPRPVRLTQLDPQANYQVRLVNADQIPTLSRGQCLLAQGEHILSGAYLMAHGLTLPWGFPQSMWVIEGHTI